MPLPSDETTPPVTKMNRVRLVALHVAPPADSEGPLDRVGGRAERG